MELLQAITVFILVSVTSGQDCRELRDVDLGDTNTPSTTGLLASALAAGSGEVNPTIQILESNKVCLGQGAVRDTYGTVSLVVSYFKALNVNLTVQVEYQCTEGVWGFDSQPSVTTAPQASLTTVLRRDCIFCLKPGLGATVTPEEHCAVCNASCDPNGLMRCTGQLDPPTCCNFFNMSGSCVEMCPQKTTPVNSSDCVCASGYEEAPANTCSDIDECDSDPCLNGATCNNIEGDFNCICALGFTGEICDAIPCAIDGCLTCSDNSTCIKCEDGQTLTDGKCEGSSNNNTPIIIGVVVAIIVAVLLILLTIGTIATIKILGKKKSMKNCNKVNPEKAEENSEL